MTTEKRNRGFTLVELLIVIVILGILASVTVFAVRGITTKTKSTACLSDKRVLEIAAESYMAQHGSYPSNTTTMVDAGLLRDVTVGNFSYVYTPPTAGTENYTITPLPAGPCA
jgi:prepilin-type N-terminal cleavage/methylation domain-containing protein